MFAKGHLFIFSLFDWGDMMLNKVKVAAKKEQVNFLLFLPVAFHICWFAAGTVSACPQRHLEYMLAI